MEETSINHQTLIYLHRGSSDLSSLGIRTTFLTGNSLSTAELGLSKELREMLPIVVFRESFSLTDSHSELCFGLSSWKQLLCSNASSAAAATTYVPRRGRSSGSQSIERIWRRQVQIVLAIDAAICLTLLGVWLAICQGIECTRS